MRGEILDECHLRFQLALDSARADVKDMRHRLAEVEAWLRESVTPGVMGVQVGLYHERLERKEAFAKVAENFWDLVPADGSTRIPAGLSFADAVAVEEALAVEVKPGFGGRGTGGDEDQPRPGQGRSLNRFRQQLRDLKQEAPKDLSTVECQASWPALPAVS